MLINDMANLVSQLSTFSILIDHTNADLDVSLGHMPVATRDDQCLLSLREFLALRDALIDCLHGSIIVCNVRHRHIGFVDFSELVRRSNYALANVP